jgi:transposase
VRLLKLLKVALGVEHTVVEDAVWETAGDGHQVVVVKVRPTRSRRGRCSRCGHKSRGYDAGGGRRRWRTLDLGVLRVFLEADAPRVRCRRCVAVVVAAVPWARPASRFTAVFEETVTWLSARMPTSTVAELSRITWTAASQITGRVVADLAGRTDRLEGLTRVGIDEVSYRKGHRYIMRVIDHDTGRQVWAAKGRSQDVVRAFFDALGPERSKLITHVTCDGAEWIHDAIREKAPQATICLDPFHVVMWATEALEKLRRRLAAGFRADGRDGKAQTVKGTRWALIKNPEDLSTDQRTIIADLEKTNMPLYTGYLLKEQLREIFKTRHGGGLLAGLIAWCAESATPEFVKLGTTLHKFRQLINNSLESGLSNARVEGANTQLRALTKRANGYHSAEALIAATDLTAGGLCPPLPGR